MKDKIGSSGLLFLQETHSDRSGLLFLQETRSDSKIEQKWKGNFKDSVFFSYGKSNSCGILTAYFGTKTFTVKKQQTDKEGRILILDVSINDSEYILINLYDANTVKEQINVLSILFELLEEFDTNQTKQLVLAGISIHSLTKIGCKIGCPKFYLRKKIFS